MGAAGRLKTLLLPFPRRLNFRLATTAAAAVALGAYAISAPSKAGQRFAEDARPQVIQPTQREDNGP